MSCANILHYYGQVWIDMYMFEWDKFITLVDS